MKRGTAGVGSIFWTILSADIDISHIESQYNTYIHTYVFYYFNIYLELRYGNNNCRFHENVAFFRSAAFFHIDLIGTAFLDELRQFRSVDTSMRLKESFCFSFSAGEYENIVGSCLKGN